VSADIATRVSVTFANVTVEMPKLFERFWTVRTCMLLGLRQILES
jgi:hypothetical protein